MSVAFDAVSTEIYETELQPFNQSMRAFLTAMDYQDPVLIRSHLNSACEMLAETIEAKIQDRRGWPQVAEESCNKILAEVEGHPLENVDDIGKKIESLFDQMIGRLTELRDQWVVPLKDRGIEIESAPVLEELIRELRSMKTIKLKDWPWSKLPLPLVNRKMIEASRASLARGEGERIEDLIRRLGGTPSKG